MCCQTTGNYIETMAKEIKKAVLSIKSKVSTIDTGDNGERRIRFVATSINKDRHNEEVRVDSLRLPLKAGGEIIVGTIPAEGVSEIVDIPLMLNHSLDVRDVIGSVRSAYYENGELIFECGISKREIAQEMLVLLEEGHLSNAFSITMADYDYNFETETISNAEIIEVSLVFRGSNKEARLLAVKSLKGENMNKDKSASTDSFGSAAESQEEVQNNQVQNEQSETPLENAPAGEATNNQPESNINEGESSITQEGEAMGTVENQIAAENIQKAVPNQIKQVATNGYLKTKQALVDFANVLIDNAGKTAAEVQKAWSEVVKSKGITNPDVLLPGALVTAITDGLNKNSRIWNSINKTGLTVRRISADTVAGADGGRARGHKKGTNKTEIDITLLDRVLRGQYIYAYLPINKEDIRENQDTGALVKYVVSTLTKRIITEVERAIILGDGRTGDEVIKSFISIKADAKDNAKPFASLYEPKTGEKLYVSMVNAVAEIEMEGDIYAVMSRKKKAELRLNETTGGNLVLSLGSNMAEAYEIKEIITPSWMKDDEIDVVLYVGEAYEMVGDETVEQFQNFALQANKVEYLQEIYAGGGLAQIKSAVAIKKAQ